MASTRGFAALGCLLALAACSSGGSRPPAVAMAAATPVFSSAATESADGWYRSGAEAAAARGAGAQRARNLILFVGDGMSLTTVTAARILEGQRQGQPGEEHRLGWEDFPATAFSRTYNTDSQTPDSAGTMTAMATGVKTRRGLVAVGPTVTRGDCRAALAEPLVTLWELAAASGMATGVVTSTRATHATPASSFTHVPERGWESDSETDAVARAAGCRDIAWQLVEPASGRGLDVLLAGGRRQFMRVDQIDPGDPSVSGLRQDGRDLLTLWQARSGGRYVSDQAQLRAALAQATATPLLGLFAPSHLRFEHDRALDPGGEPALAELTAAAIERLQALSRQRGDSGYLLLVEAGRIDHAHHYGNAYRALTDTLALSDAVRLADRTTAADDTLILVTADHSHTLSFAGYPVRGNPILGKVRGGSGEDDGDGPFALDAMGLPYTTLAYANGPGYQGGSDLQPFGSKRFPHLPGKVQPGRGRSNLATVDTEHPDYLQEAQVPLTIETHGGDDVGVWARGPGSAAVRGSLEQHTLFHLMVQANQRMRDYLCRRGRCNHAGVPSERPLPQDLQPND